MFARMSNQYKYFCSVENRRVLNISLDEVYLKKHFHLDSYDSFLTEEEMSFFSTQTAIRILENHKELVFLNYCPVCGILARTPMAKQCINGHKWDNLNHNQDTSIVT